MPIPIPLNGLLAKIESTYATDSVPAGATDAVRLSDRLWNALTPDYAWHNRRDLVSTGTAIPPPPAVPRGRMVSLDFGWEVKGSRSGGAYASANKIEASPLLRACGIVEALDTTGGSEKLTYTHADQAHDSCTIYAYAGGWLYKIVGCRGVMSWPINVGVLTTLRFRMQGLLTTNPSTASVPSETYATPAPLAGVNLALTVGSWTPDIITAGFDQGPTLQRLDSGNAADGIQSFDWGDTVQPLFRLSAKGVPLATYDPYAIQLARTSQAIALVYNSGVQYDRAKLNAVGYLDGLRHAEQNGFIAWDLEYLLDGTWALKFD